MAHVFIGLVLKSSPDYEVFIDGLDPYELYASVNPGRWKRIKKKLSLKIGFEHYSCEEQNRQDVLEVAIDHPWQDIISFAKNQGKSNIIYSYSSSSENVTETLINKRLDKKWQVDRLTYTMDANYLFFPKKKYAYVIVKNPRTLRAWIMKPEYYSMPESKHV